MDLVEDLGKFPDDVTLMKRSLVELNEKIERLLRRTISQHTVDNTHHAMPVA